MRVARAIVLVLLTVHQTGCASWRSIGHERPADFVERRRPGLVQIMVADSALVIRHPLVRGDSLIGLAPGTIPPRRVAVPMASIQTLAVRPDAPKGARIVLGTVGLFLVVSAVALAIHDPPPVYKPN